MLGQAPFFILVQEKVVRQDHLGPVGDTQVWTGHAVLEQAFQLLQESQDVEGHARTEQVNHAWVKHARGQQVEHEFAPFVDDGMPCVVAALETDNDIRRGRQDIGDLPLALIAPIGPDNGSDWHAILLRDWTQIHADEHGFLSG